MTYSDIQNSGPSDRCFVYSKEKLENKPHDLRPPLVAGEISVLPFVVVEKARVVDGDCEPPLRPMQRSRKCIALLPAMSC